MPNDPPDEQAVAVVVLVTRRHVAWAIVGVVAFLLSLFILRTYARAYDPQFGWTKLIMFGSDFAPVSLPRLQRTTHYVTTDPDLREGYDAQFYAQMALDPSLGDPAFDRALDNPLYRARRIGLPAAAYVLGLGNRERILEVYALANPCCWFILLGALSWLLKPDSAKHLLCLCGGTLCYGVFASMERSLIDLPATALIFAGVAFGSWSGGALLAAALLTRETSLLAASGWIPARAPRGSGGWKRPVAIIALASLPLAGWLIYVHHRFGYLGRAAGEDNFGWPLVGMVQRAVEAMNLCAGIGFGNTFHKPWRLEWLYFKSDLLQLDIIASIFFQGLYLALRPDLRSAAWRIGVCYVALGAVLGPSVWTDPSAAARVLLPMTICFYLRLARERAAWFWPFFLLGSLPIPHGIHEFWTWS